MEPYKDTIDRFIVYICHGQDDKKKEIWEYYENIIFRRVKIKLFNTHLALLQCKNFEEIAEEFTRAERKKKPLTPDAIRKRSEKLFTIIEESISRRYGNK